jgi:hypothetical protein
MKKQKKKLSPEYLHALHLDSVSEGQTLIHKNHIEAPSPYWKYRLGKTQ